MSKLFCGVFRLVLACWFLAPLAAQAQSGLGEGFSKLPDDAKVVVMPLDVELFSISGGGVLEPQAEWTNNALRNLKDAFAAKKTELKVSFVDLADDGDEAVEDLNRLHGAVGAAINIHYLGTLKLPTKAGKLDWSLGDGVAVIRSKTGADYALFTFIRDSYSTGERIATMIVAAMFGVGLGGGMQAGYASLVDLQTGRIVWFNRLIRASGDLREPDKARESLNALLAKFPR